MFAASYQEGLSSTLTSSEVSLTSDLLWSKLGLVKDCIYPCFIFCDLFTIILILYLLFLPYWYMKTRTLSEFAVEYVYHT